MATRPLEVFDVSVLRGDGHVWVSVHSEQGSVFGVPRALPVWPLAVPDPEVWLADAVGRAREARESALAVGAELTRLVFGSSDVGALLQQTRGAVGAAGGQVLLRVLAAPQDVSSWPWELMTDPQKPTEFLTLARDVHVVRSGRTRTYPVRRAPIEPPLNLLLVMSSPLPDGPTDRDAVFDLYAEKRSLLAELEPLVERGLLTVEVEDRPTLENLRSRIGAQRRGFHLLHYLGHARPDGLKLEHRNGRGSFVRSADFARLLQQMPDLRLAVFAGCETARAPKDNPVPAIDEWPGPLSTADYCVRDASPLVVGMQAVLPFDTERLFTRFFYQALGGGQAVAEALRLARLAIESDEFSGGNLINWAVPCLFGGGTMPGPITDPQARAEPAARRHRVTLRLGVRQGELRFISRLSELREAIDVLSGRKSTRLLHVIGLRGTGKTALLDRAVEELDDGVIPVFVAASVLLADPDPLAELCRIVADTVRRAGIRTAPAGRRDASDHWDRLLEEIVDVRLALVVDDIDRLAIDTAGVAPLRDALAKMTQRRGRIRLAVAGVEEFAALTQSLSATELSKITLNPLSWPEVWDWIRRNQPVLTRFNEWTLAPYFHDLPHLEQWAELASRLSARDAATSEEIAIVIREVVSRSAPSQLLGPTLGTEPLPTEPMPVERGPLRIAVAGEFVAGRDEEFGRAVTTFAARRWVSGRMVVGASADATSALAELVPVPSPFAGGPVTTARILDWLQKAAKADADLLVLDYGTPDAGTAHSSFLTQLAAEGRLLIAAGGNDMTPCYPAFFPDVLGIGALQSDAVEAAYSTYAADQSKPDLYAPGRLAETELATMVSDPQVEGTSMSALYATAAAIAVWASDRDLKAADVRRILVDTAARFTTRSGATARRLDVDAALLAVRRQLLLDTLEFGALQIGQLVAETGLRPEVLVPMLLELVGTNEVTRGTTDGDERYENPNALYLQYARLRQQQPAGWDRTVQMEALVGSARELARRGRYSAAKARALWASGHDGRRMVALAIMQARHDLASLPVLRDAISASRSAFEQYQALRLAVDLKPTLSGSEINQLRDAVRENLPDQVDDPSRAKLAAQLLAE